MAANFEFKLADCVHEVTIRARRPTLAVEVDGVLHYVSETQAHAADCVQLSVDGHSYEVWRTWEGDRVHLHLGGHSYSLGYADAISAAQQHAGTDDCLRADMPGVVVGVHCDAEAQVALGDVLMVIESMKMQINIVAHRAGRIDEVHVAINQSFDKGAALVTMHAEVEAA